MANIPALIKNAQDAVSEELNNELEVTRDSETDEISGSQEASFLQTVLTRLDEAAGAHERYDNFVNPKEGVEEGK